MAIKIDSKEIKILRDMTMAGMSDCKKALIASEGDLDAAVDLLRKWLGNKALTKMDRNTKQGSVCIKAHIENMNASAYMAVVNSETDFVARNEEFINFYHDILRIGHKKACKSLSELLSAKSDEGPHFYTVDELRVNLIAKTGENINISKYAVMHAKASDNECIGHYLHAEKIGVLVRIKFQEALNHANFEEMNLFARDIAMHIAAQAPIAIDRNGLPEDLIKKEYELAKFQADSEMKGKPDAIIEKMIEGKVAKNLSALMLLEQAYVKDPTIKVSQLLAKKLASVMEFYRFTLSE